MAPSQATAHVPSTAELMEGMAAKLREYAANPNHGDLIGKPDGNPVQIRPAFPNAQDFTASLVTGVQNNPPKHSPAAPPPPVGFGAAAPWPVEPVRVVAGGFAS